MIINVCILVGFLHTHGFKYIHSKVAENVNFLTNTEPFKKPPQILNMQIYVLQIVSSKNVKTRSNIIESRDIFRELNARKNFFI